MNATHETGDAQAEVAGAMRSRMDSLSDLLCACAHPLAVDGERLEALGVEPGQSENDMRDQADDALMALPLAVERVVSFEIVLGIGGPTETLIIECNVVERDRADGRGGIVGSRGYEIRRVYFRYSWTGSAVLDLSGADREAAEAFAHRVVPELIE